MPKYRVESVVTVSTYTIVEAENEGEALEEASTRDVNMTGYGHLDTESWIVDDIDGEVDLDVADIEEIKKGEDK
jgi:hypothetical protein